MAGELDFTGAGFGDMLTDEERRGALNNALLQAGIAMMGASGWSPVKPTIGQALASGVGQGLNAYQQIIASAPQRQMQRIALEKARQEAELQKQFNSQGFAGVNEKQKAAAYRAYAAQVAIINPEKSKQLLDIADKLDPEVFQPVSDDEAAKLGLPAGNRYQRNSRNNQISVLASNEQWHMLTPEEKAQMGLNANQAYMGNASGKVQEVGGSGGIFGSGERAMAAQEMLRQFPDTPENRLKLAQWIANQPTWTTTTDAAGNIRMVQMPGTPLPALSRTPPPGAQSAPMPIPSGAPAASQPRPQGSTPAPQQPSAAGAPMGGGGIIGQRPVTQSEKKVAGFATRMEDANGVLAQVEDSGRPGYMTQATGALLGETGKTAVMSKEQQRYNQAVENWVSAQLRAESGAVIGPDEYQRTYRTFFPQPGEGPEVAAQKARARQIATQAMIDEAGSAYSRRAPQQPATQQRKPDFRFNPATGKLERVN